MRRAECIEWPPCPRPDQVAVRNKWDYSHRHPYISYQARSQIIMSEGHDVLNVDIFEGFRLVARYFADVTTGSHVALIMDTGEWKKCILQNVVNVCAGLSPLSQNYGTYSCFQSEQFAWASDKDEKRANGYICRAKGNYYSLAYWESMLQSKRRERQQQNKQERINLMLDWLTPPVPEDFYRWMHEDVFGKKYLFQHKDRERKVVICSCGACKEKWTQEKAVGLGWRTCPKCGKDVQGSYRSEETAAETLFLLQPCRDPGKWVERVFYANCSYKPGQETFVGLDEVIRYVIGKGKSWGECYYEDFFQDGQPIFWDSNRNMLKTRAGYLYPGSLGACAGSWSEKLRNAGLHILAREMVKANYNYIITTWHAQPWFEYLVKAGFYRMITEMSTDTYSESEKTGRLNGRGRSMQEVLRLNAGRVDRLRQFGGSFKALNWLQFEQTMNQKISTENMTFLMKHFWPDQSDVWKALGYVKSANVFANYVRKQSKLLKMTPAAVVNDWVDYLDMAAKQGLNLSHEIFYKPRNLKEAHDTCVREARLQESQKKAKGILEKFPNVEKNMDAIRDKYTYVGEKFCIRVPDGIPDIIHEGRALGHCIDTTDRYFDRINQNISYLVFLRRRSAPTVPYYTLEIEPGGTIRQQRTTGNNQNKQDVEEYGPFIREWQEEIRKRLTEADRAAAQNSRSVRMEEYRELREKKEKVWHGKLAGALLADVLEADLIENVI